MEELKSTKIDKVIVKEREEANTFSLQANYTEGNMVFTLTDYIDWVIYSKAYTHQDIGKEVHRQIDLLDLCTAFSLVSLQGDEYMQRKKTQDKYKSYVFGTIVKNQSGSSYKIQRKGILTIYTSVLFLQGKKEVIFESVLNLQKVRELTEIQIKSIKTNLQMREFNTGILLQLKELKSENSQLKQQVCNQKKIIEKLLNQQNVGEEKFKNAFEKINEEQKKIQQARNKEVMEMKIQLNNFKEQMGRQITKFKNRILLVDKTAPQYPKFEIRENIIRHIGYDHTWYQILMQDAIPKNKAYRYKVKILHAKYSNVMFGVMDRLVWKSYQCFCGQTDSIYYDCSFGQVYPKNLGIKGGVVKTGETMEIRINLEKGKVEFKVANIVRATVYDYKILMEPHREFVFCIQLYHFNDCVQWIESQEMPI